MAQAAFKDRTKPVERARKLRDLRGIGPAMMRDFEVLGVHTVDELASQTPEELYNRLGELQGVRQDPCVLDTFTCAIAQARNPRLADRQKDWWYWSRKRKAPPRA